VPPILSAQCDPPRSLSTPLHATIADTCKRHGVSRTKLYAILATKQIIARKLDRRILIDVESADRYFASLPQADIRVPSLNSAAA
jgi:hypothetical protein